MTTTFSEVTIETYKLPPDLIGYFEPALCDKCYVCRMVAVFREVRRVLRKDGTCWLNLGDSYAANRGYQVPDNKWGDVGNNSGASVPAGLKTKDLVGIPWRVAFALQADGWWLRSDIIWHKPNPMPESCRDRPTKSHEYIFLLTKAANYYYDQEAVREPLSPTTQADPRMQDMGRVYGGKGRGAYGEEGQANGSMQAWSLNPAGRNRRTVWTIPTSPYSGAHFATMPRDLVRPCILAGSSPRACEHCGAPWERVVEREKGYSPEANNEHRKKTKGMGAGSTLGMHGNGSKEWAERGTKSTTTGWRATCTCDNAGTGRCIVLDPFYGSGTVGMVAAEYGRRAVGVELSPEYIKLALARTAQARAQGVMAL